MNAAYLLDVNVLMAISWPDNVNHAAAQRWFRDHRKAGWATCPMTQTAFVRLSSNRSVTENALHPPAAISVLEKNTQNAYHEFWSDNLTLPEAVAPFRDRIHGHQQIADAYLLGLSMRKKARLVTFDKAISSLLPPSMRKSDHIVQL
jgi:hypothetical protein